MRKKTFIALTILFLLFVLAPNLSAQDLEIDYPEVPGIECGDNVCDPGENLLSCPDDCALEDIAFGAYARYLFYFLIYGSGVLALFALIIAGIIYLTSTGNPDKMKEAKDRIISAILGLAIILGVYAIVWQINPQMVDFTLSELDPLINTLNPGVLACRSTSNHVLEAWGIQMDYMLKNPSQEEKEIAKTMMDSLLRQIEDDCYYAQKGEVADKFDNKIKRLWFVPEITYDFDGKNRHIADVKQFGAIVFEQDMFRGLGRVYLSQMLISALVPLPTSVDLSLEVSSMILFKGSDESLLSSGWSVRLYEEKEHNLEFTDDSGNPLPPFFEETSAIKPWLGDIDFATSTITPIPVSEDEEIFPKSMQREGDILVILYKGEAETKTDTTCQRIEDSRTLNLIEREVTVTCPDGYTITEHSCSDSLSLGGTSEIAEVTDTSLTCKGKDETVMCIEQGACDTMKAVIRCCGEEEYMGRYFEAFYAQDDNNLVDNYNLVNFGVCPDVKKEAEDLTELLDPCEWSEWRGPSNDQDKDCLDYFGPGYVMVNYDCHESHGLCAVNRIKCCQIKDLPLGGLGFCPEPAVNGIVVISGIEPI